MHGHVDTAAGMATGGLQTFAQVGIEVDPLLQFAVGRLRIEAGEIELGLNVSIDFVLVFTDVKILKISGNAMRKATYNLQKPTIIYFNLHLPTLTYKNQFSAWRR